MPDQGTKCVLSKKLGRAQAIQEKEKRKKAKSENGREMQDVFNAGFPENSVRSRLECHARSG